MPIQTDKLLVLGLFVVVIAATVGLQMLHSQDVAAPTTQPDHVSVPPATPALVGQFRGISLQLHNAEPNHPYEEYIDEIAATGANTVCLVVTAYQENASSSSLFIEARKSPTRQRLKDLIAYAQRKGLHVALMPIVLLENPRAKEWRGKIEPTSWDAWWEDYRNYVLHYAWVAEEAGVHVFVLGSELVSTETQTEPWRALIADVRKRYRGLLTYSANWDHYEVIEWWDQLDMIGMTTYYDLVDGENPTVAQLCEAWKKIKASVLKWQARIDKPLLFTEVGWPNQATCAQYPWDYYRATDKPDPRAQATCFEAFFKTWIDSPAVAGFLVWEWRNHPGQNGGLKDTSYIPRGKPAMKVISRYFQMPAPASQPTQPAAGPQPVESQSTTND